LVGYIRGDLDDVVVVLKSMVVRHGILPRYPWPTQKLGLRRQPIAPWRVRCVPMAA
jgi:hypothetical protein